VAGEHSPEFDEILGYHLEQAYRYREELGNIDERARALAVRAAEHLGAAGRRALNRSDLAAGQALLTRTAELLPADDPDRLTLLLDLGWALNELGEFARATAVIQELKEAARAAGDQALELRADLLEVWRWDTSMAWDERAKIARKAIAFYEEREDDTGLFFAHRILGAMHWTQGRAAESVEELQQVLEFGRRAGTPNEALLLHWLGGALVWGPTPADMGCRSASSCSARRLASAWQRDRS
jgi:tetratricopeptide (TPR) repeat protein